MKKNTLCAFFITHNGYLIAGLLCCAIIIAPLAFNPYSLFPYEHLQVIIWRTFIVLGVLLLLIKILFGGHYYTARSYKIIFIPIALILLWASVTTLLAVNSTVAWWGSSYRFQGLFSLLHYIAATVLILVGIEKKYLPKIMGSIMISGTLAGLWAIGQRLGFDPWAYPIRAFSSFGHPNFLAVFLVMTGLITTGFLRGRYRWLSMMCLYIQITALFLTFTRTAWVAFVVPLFIMLLALWQKRSIIGQRILIFITLTVLLVGVCSYFTARLINKNAQYAYAVFSSTAPLPFVLEEAKQNVTTTNPLDDRVSSMTNLQEGSMLVRWYIWQDVVDVIKAHPWLGIGQDTLYIIYPEFYRLEPQRPAIAQGTYTDRAHNEILDLLLSYGGIGLIIWLTAYGIILLTFIRSLKRVTTPDHLIAIVTVGGAIIGYWIFNMLGFSVTMTAALFWTCVGILYKDSCTSEHSNICQIQLSYKPIIAIIGTLGILLIIVQYNIFPAMASYYGYQSIRPGITTVVAEQNLQQAVQLAPNVERYYLFLAETYLTNAQASSTMTEKITWLQQAETAANQAKKTGLDNLAFWDLMVNIYGKWPNSNEALANKNKYEQEIRTWVPYFGIKL